MLITWATGKLTTGILATWCTTLIVEGHVAESQSILTEEGMKITTISKPERAVKAERHVTSKGC